MANFFSQKRASDFTYENRWLATGEVLFLIVGVGVQELFNTDPKLRDLIPGETIRTTYKDFRFKDGQMRFLTTMQRKNVPIFFRGDFTRDASKLAGYNSGVSNGCPSLMISHDVRLGRMLQTRYEQLKLRVGDRSLKLAINIKPTPNFVKLYKYLLARYPNSYIYAQGTSDFRSLNNSGVPIGRMRYFANVEEWRESLRGMDASFGGRIHGNMIALSVGLPVFVVAPDHRVLELVRRMMVPHVTVYDHRLALDGLDVASVVTERAFDGERFDRNRCGIAKKYIHVFEQFGIGVQPHVREIAKIC